MDTPHEKELFNILFTHNMLQYLNIVERLNPEQVNNSRPCFDSHETIQEKIHQLAHTVKLKKKPTQTYNQYVENPTTWGEDPIQYIYMMLKKTNQNNHVGTVVEFLDNILTLGNVTDNGRKIFYANLKYEPKTFLLISEILENTEKEHYQYDGKTLTRNIHNHVCECVNKTLGRAKKKYGTKAEALKHAELSGSRKNIILGVYMCVSKNGKQVWHLTNKTVNNAQNLAP